MTMAAAIEHRAPNRPFFDDTDEPSALFELREQGFWRCLEAALEQNDIVGRAAWPSCGQPAPLHADVAQAEVVQPPDRRRREFRIFLQRYDGAGEARNDG